MTRDGDGDGRAPGDSEGAAPGLALYGYWRSSAAYRVRLALAWKRLDYTSIPIDLRHGVQVGADYLARNPQGLVPLLTDGGAALTQSLAIIEYLDETRPDPPLLPPDPLDRAQVRAAAQLIACDIHPINNLRVLRYLKDPLGHDQAEIDAWARHWIAAGLAALEQFSVRFGGRFVFGDTLSLADLCLVPQLYNARRVDLDLGAFGRLCAIESMVMGTGIFAAAHPDAQLNPA
jgi:maleylacetoacetate isomerase/maleylpyruvate isomerase